MNRESMAQQVAEIIILEGRLSFAVVSSKPVDTPREHFFSIEEDPAYVFRGFFADFGPLHLGCVHNFCLLTDRKLQENPRKDVIFYTSPHEHLKANAAFLVGAYVIIRHNFTATDVLRLFIKLRFIPFRDASYGICGFMLSYLDCMRGIEHALKCGLYNFDTFDVKQYLHLHELQNGDINWILPGKFLAFSGPYDQRRPIGPKMFAYGVDDYVPVFKKLGVTCVVRLNKKCYDKRRFTQHGIKVKELIYEDGSCPPPSILRKFLALATKEPCLAVHCKAGLGRTGTCIAVYMMKHLGFTARAIIAWCRICRPGSLLGPQQLYLERHEDEFLAEYARRRAGIGHITPISSSKAASNNKPASNNSNAFLQSSKAGVHESKSAFSKSKSPTKSPTDKSKLASNILPAFEDKILQHAPDAKVGGNSRLSYPEKKQKKRRHSGSSAAKGIVELRLQSNVLVPLVKSSANNRF